MVLQNQLGVAQEYPAAGEFRFEGCILHTFSPVGYDLIWTGLHPIEWGGLSYSIGKGSGPLCPRSDMWFSPLVAFSATKGPVDGACCSSLLTHVHSLMTIPLESRHQISCRSFQRQQTEWMR